MRNGQFDLSGRVAIVTGGNGGIGLGMARGLADAGAAVAVVGRNEAKSKAAVEDLAKRGVKAIAVATDVTDKAAVAAMTASLAAEVGPDGILVNAVAPGILDTSANREAMPEADSSAWVPPEALARVIGGLIAPGEQVTTGAVIPVYGPGGAGG